VNLVADVTAGAHFDFCFHNLALRGKLFDQVVEITVLTALENQSYEMNFLKITSDMLNVVVNLRAGE